MDKEKLKLTPKEKEMRTLAAKRLRLFQNKGPSLHKQINMAYANSPGKVKPKYK